MSVQPEAEDRALRVHKPRTPNPASALFSHILQYRLIVGDCGAWCLLTGSGNKTQLIDADATPTIAHPIYYHSTQCASPAMPPLRQNEEELSPYMDCPDCPARKKSRKTIRRHLILGCNPEKRERNWYMQHIDAVLDPRVEAAARRRQQRRNCPGYPRDSRHPVRRKRQATPCAESPVDVEMCDDFATPGAGPSNQAAGPTPAP
ncbi:hypothetical protein FRC12_001787 [Ceratobasidium sp. 428]|nr:hypothetical protein FRC12_001787 [Ceratobasidium sp. 428]